MINLVYIRAAIQAKTGKWLPLKRVRELLVEEGLITQKQAETDAVIFRGYGDLFWTDVPMKDVEDLDEHEGLPDHYIPGS